MRVAVLIFGRFLSPIKEGAMPTPCNVYPVKCRSDFTGVESFLFLSGSMLHALCAMLATPLGLHAPYAMRYALCRLSSVISHLLSAPCAMLVTPLGFSHSLGSYPIKLHQRSVSGAFLCLLLLMTRAVKQEKQNMSQTKTP